MERELAGETPVISARAKLLRRILTDLAIMTVIGVFLAVIGPFGSIEEPLAVRLVTWLTFSFLGYAIYSPMSFVVERMHSALDLPRAPLWVAAVMAATVPMTALIYVIQFMPNWPPIPPLEEALISYFYVFVIGGGVTLLFNFIGPDRPAAAQMRAGVDDRVKAAVTEQSVPVQSAASEAGDDAPANANASTTANTGAAQSTNLSNPLLDQLPAEIGSDVIALEMEDHYVRVHTMLGSELVLMRLRDAMAHMGEVDGKQVHRSWWVARLAVEDVKREGRNVRLVLAGGLEAPVSRAQVSELKTAGWM